MQLKFTRLGVFSSYQTFDDVERICSIDIIVAVFLKAGNKHCVPYDSAFYVFSSYVFHEFILF